MRTTITAAKWQAFLARLGEGDTVEAAARAAEADRRSFKRYRESDPNREGEFQAACDAGNQMLEQQLVRVALGQVKANQPAVTAALLVLKYRLPEWREAARQHTPPRPVRSEQRDLSKLSDEELARFEQMLEKITDVAPEP